jgi:signal transduction histidine kinase
VHVPPIIALGAVTILAMVLATTPGLPVWALIGGIAGAGVLGLVALLIVGRGVAREYRGLAAIRRALKSASDERLGGAEQSAAALGVSVYFGPEARAFQAILNQRDELRKQARLAEMDEKLGQREGSAAMKSELAGVCDALWVGIMLLDAELRVLYANGAAGVMLGFKREQSASVNAAGLLGDEKLTAMVKQVASGESRSRQSIELRRLPAPVSEAGQEGESDRRGKAAARAVALPDGATVLKFTVRPLRHDDAGAALVVIEDVTQQRVADEARNRFVAHATHELRTPLTNIRLYVEELVEAGESDAQARGKCINVISTEARRLERIVGDMLSVSEIEAGSLKVRMGDVQLPALFEELEHDYRAGAESKKQKLVFDLPPKWPTLRGDRDKLALAIHNLVGNALKYTPEGGSVTVKAGEEGAALVVSVTDTGIGIKEEELGLIFDRFYRAQDKRIAGITGSGLGLALAREIARMHGGDITVTSRIDQGSTFTLRVPIVAAPAEARKAA